MMQYLISLHSFLYFYKLLLFLQFLFRTEKHLHNRDRGILDVMEFFFKGEFSSLGADFLQ